MRPNSVVKGYGRHREGEGTRVQVPVGTKLCAYKKKSL